MNKPSGEKILSLLVELLADQHDVKVEYVITTKEKEGEVNEEKNEMAS